MLLLLLPLPLMMMLMLCWSMTWQEEKVREARGRAEAAERRLEEALDDIERLVILIISYHNLLG